MSAGNMKDLLMDGIHRGSAETSSSRFAAESGVISLELEVFINDQLHYYEFYGRCNAMFMSLLSYMPLVGVPDGSAGPECNLVNTKHVLSLPTGRQTPLNSTIRLTHRTSSRNTSGPTLSGSYWSSSCMEKT